MKKKYVSLYVTAFFLLIASGFALLVFLAGIAAAVSGSGNSAGAETLWNFVVGLFWLSMATFAIAIVSHIQYSVDKSVTDEPEEFELDLDSETE